jgi:hypothetical protein
MRRVALILGLALMLAPAVALADGIGWTHESREDFFSNGGTRVSGCFGPGCPSTDFTIGDATGDVWWQVVEKVFYDGIANTTEFTYTVFNDQFADPITSFHVLSQGIQGVSWGAPPGWDFSQVGDYWLWWTDVPASGIAAHKALDEMHVTLGGNVPVTFALAKIDLTGSGGNYFLTGSDWRASSPVPEPGTLALLGTGLIGIAGVIRRKLRS